MTRAFLPADLKSTAHPPTLPHIAFHWEDCSISTRPSHGTGPPIRRISTLSTIAVLSVHCKTTSSSWSIESKRQFWQLVNASVIDQELQAVTVFSVPKQSPPPTTTFGKR